MEAKSNKAAVRIVASPKTWIEGSNASGGSSETIAFKVPLIVGPPTPSTTVVIKTAV